LQYGQSGNFDTGSRKVIYIGKCETARIVGISGNTLTISVHPTLSGAGLRNGYPVGTPIELVKVVTYSWGTMSSARPYGHYLKRFENDGSGIAEWQKMIAGNIEDIQLTPDNKTCRDFTITITGRTSAEDFRYTDPVKGDHYRRNTITVSCQSRQPDW
jgi:hypothetical protein